MSPAMQSKTFLGLLILLAAITGLAFAGKLNGEAVEALQWVGGAFMAVRVTANATENLKGKSDAQN